jgi:hypothetical protein
MKRLGTVVGAGVLVLLASACANPQENQQTPGDNPPGNTSTSEATPDKQPARKPPEGGTPVRAAQIDATALPKGYPVMVWTVDKGRAVGVVAQEGGCGKASVELAAQTDSQVVLTLVETTPADAEMCTMDLRYPKITTDLDESLNERQVVLKAEQRKK